MKLSILTLSTVIVFSLGSVHAGETSETNAKMRKFLNLFPASDANPKNGVLTQSELYTFLLNRVPSSATSNASTYWGKQLKRFNSETNGKADTKPRDGILTKSEMISYVGRRS